MELIETDSPYSDDDLVGYNHTEEEEIRKLLLGTKITKVADDHIRLSTGAMVKIVPTGDCCVQYTLDDLNSVDNIITAVEFITEEKEGAEVWAGTYNVFVIAEDKYVKAWSVSGDDGNGYYGTGYSLIARIPERMAFGRPDRPMP
jgi:hypothetical protein